MTDSMDFAFFRGRIFDQRRRIRNRLRAPTTKWPLLDEDREELEAIDALLDEIDRYGRDIQASLSAPTPPATHSPPAASSK